MIGNIISIVNAVGKDINLKYEGYIVFEDLYLSQFND